MKASAFFSLWSGPEENAAGLHTVMYVTNLSNCGESPLLFNYQAA